MLGTVGHFQETSLHRPLFQAAQMPVLREHVRWIIYHRWALVVGIRDAVADVDNLVVRLQRE